MPITALCVHGHFYQPPREDPLTGEIPLEPGADPYRNWNERILAECYAPNALAGNMARISFNVGPTLFNWMQMADPITAERIIAQDRQNLQMHGVGNAMAQPYHHTILPLATYEDKVTQVRWGIADFKMRFGHDPLGMWLPETAADNETLSVLAEHGIQFTILAPWQAVDPQIDPTQPYIVELPGGRKITVFFYCQPVSTAVSFDPGSTINADRFVNGILLPQYRKKSREPQLVLVASDGELYGHHQRYRDKFLSYLLDGAVKNTGIEVTYPALWLREHPAYRSMAIVQNSSWSCHHGVIRWSGACGCTPNGAWKAYLRQAFEQIASAVDDIYYEELSPLFSDPWEVRHNYIYVLQSQVRLEDLLCDMAGKQLSERAVQRIRLLLAAAYERQRMFTSCGWFFDDFDRIEPRNAIAYAAQAIWLTYQATGIDLVSEALSWLHPVQSWRSELRADEVFNRYLLRVQHNPRE